MLSIDTNLLLHAFNEDSPVHEAAYAWMLSVQKLEEVAISEFILAEFYGLLRNPSLLKRPLGAVEAVEVIQIYHRHPCWRLIGSPQKAGHSMGHSGKRLKPAISLFDVSMTRAQHSPWLPRAPQSLQR